MSILLEVTDMNVHDVYPTADVEAYLPDGGAFNPMPVGDTLRES